MQAADWLRVRVHEHNFRASLSRVVEYSDVISGAKFTRSGLDALMGEVRRGRISTIVCFNLDRLRRSLAHLAQICSELTTHNVALICTSQGIDTSHNNPAGRLQLGVLMAVAEFERSGHV
ncbi:MAG TPA: recombinase family protein [Methylomirabilota bacterium]|nr:recombinase family protein [Methylomirabilota bacterium]